LLCGKEAVVEENNQLEKNQSGSLYGTEPEPKAEENNQLSAAYGQQKPEEETASTVNLQKPEESTAPTVHLQKPEEETASTVNLQKPEESTAPTVHLQKPEEGTTSTVNLQKPQGDYGNNSQQLNQPQNGNGYYNRQQINQPQNGNNNYYNGQQINQPQNGNSYYNSQQPNLQQGYMQGQMQPGGPQYQRPKKNKTGLIIGIFVTAALLLIVVAGFMFAKFLANKVSGPQAQIVRGYENMVREMAVYKSGISDDVDFAALSKQKEEAPVHTNLDLSLVVPGSSLENVSIAFDVITDYQARKANCDVSVGTYGFDISVADVVADDNMLYFSVLPEMQKTVYSADLTNLAQDFNASPWSYYLDVEIPENYSVDLFDMDSEPMDFSMDKFGEELLEFVKSENKDTEDGVTYSKLSGTKDFEIGGQTVSCSGVTTAIDKETYNRLMEELKEDILTSDAYEEFIAGYAKEGVYTDEELGYIKQFLDLMIESMTSMRLEEDLVINYYFDSKGRIVNISTPKDIAVNSAIYDINQRLSTVQIDMISLDINFSGVERTLDKIEGGIYSHCSDGEVIYFGIDREASVTDALYKEDFSILFQEENHKEDIAVRYQNDWNYNDKSYDMQLSLEVGASDMIITADGAFSDIIKGKSYTFRLHNAAISFDGEDVLILSGIFKNEPTDDAIEVPSEAINLFEMSDEEVQQLLYGISSLMEY